MCCCVFAWQFTTDSWKVSENRSLAADRKPEGVQQKPTVSGDCGIEPHEMATGKSVFTISNGYLDRVTVLRFAPDGRSLVSVGGDRTVRQWDIATGGQQPLFEYSTRGIIGEVTISHDGQLLVAYAYDNTLTIWDLATGKSRAKLEGHGPLSHTLPVQFAPDGHKFVSWGEDRQMRWWNAANGKLITSHSTPIFPIPTLNDLLGMPNNAAYGRFSTDAKILLVQHQGQFYEFDTSTGRERRKFKLDDAATYFNRFSLSPDQRTLVTVQSIRDQKKKEMIPERLLTVLDFESLKIRREIKLAGIYMSPLTFSPDSRHMVSHTGETGRTIELINLESGDIKAMIPNVPRCSAFQFAPDGKHLAAALEDSTILILDLGKCMPTPDPTK